MSNQYYSESWNGRAATWAAGWYRCNINSMRVSPRLFFIFFFAFFHRILFCPSVLVEATAIAATIIPSGFVIFNILPHPYRYHYTFLVHYYPDFI
jgi:hypothetical protein